MVVFSAQSKSEPKFTPPRLSSDSLANRQRRRLHSTMSHSYATPASETRSGFLNIPVEIRHSIYQYLLRSPHLVIVSDNPACSRNQGILTPLLRTNRKLREELRNLLWTGVLRKKWEERHWSERMTSGRDIETIWYCDEIPALRPLGVFNASITTVVREFCPGKATILSPPLKIKDWRDIRALLEGVDGFRAIWCRTRRTDYICLTERMKQALFELRWSQSCGNIYLEKRRGSDVYDWWNEDGGRGTLQEETPRDLIPLAS